MFRAIYKPNRLTLGNPESPVGVVTLWTLKQKVASALDPSTYAAIGQHYSPTQGIDYLVRNLLANPSIRYLVLTGQDLSGSGQALRSFFEKGVASGRSNLGAPCWKIESSVESFLDPEITEEAIATLRENVSLIYLPEREGIGQIVSELANRPRPTLYAQPLVFPKREPDAKLGVGEDSVYVVRGETVGETWVQLLHYIWTFGHVSGTHYDSKQKEIVDLVTIVSNEDPNNLQIDDFLPCTAEQLERYFPTVLLGALPTTADGSAQKDIRYTYGGRLRSYFGVDQIGDVIAKLIRERDSRSAAASLWDPTTDHSLGGSPCLNHLWFRVRESKLTLTAVIRSNDMYKAWPENAFALRKLQALVRDGVTAGTGEEIDLGDLVIVSESAHIYDDDWESTEHILARQYPELASRLRFRRDPRGNFVVELEDGQIKVERIAPGGEHVKFYYGKNAQAITKSLFQDSALSSVEHSLYLGAELQKAELALKYPTIFSYIQDRPLDELTGQNGHKAKAPLETNA